MAQRKRGWPLVRTNTKYSTSVRGLPCLREAVIVDERDERQAREESVAEPFWQRSLDAITYADIASFIDEQQREGEQYEYKAASYKQNGLPEYTDKVLSSLVAFANTGGGMLFYGVDEDEETKLPHIEKGIEARPPKGAALRDPAIPLLNLCAQEINPRISLETKTVEIDAGEYAGNKILLIRVRAGSQTPYSLRNRLIYIRTGEGDELATVTEIEALFCRRADKPVGTVSPSQYIDLNIFGAAVNPDHAQPPSLMLSLVPAFPVPTRSADWQTDEVFQDLCVRLYGRGNYAHRLPHGILYAPFLANDQRDDTDCACAFEDGSIGVRKRVMHTREPALDIVGVSVVMSRVLEDAAAWPRTAMRYGGPLVCRMAMASVADLHIDVHRVAQWTQDVEPGFENKQPAWHFDTEWNSSSTAADVVEQALATLTRQLQYPFYQTIKKGVRTESNK